MRTTLKRGTGQGASLNGDTGFVDPPHLESPVSRYRQPEPPTRGAGKLVTRIVLWLLALVGVVAGGLAGGAYLYLDQKVVAFAATTPAVVRATRQLATPLPEQPTIALVVGYDRRQGREENVEARSDTIMLLRADPGTKAVSMLSFPRDLSVEIVCPGRAIRVARINEAFSDCGVEGTLQTVRRLTNLPVNYLITVNFRGFQQVVAKLGGVWIDVDRRYFNDNSRGGITYPEINLQPGYQKLNGRKSLDFVRYRHFDSDIYRLARQQLFVRSFNEQLRSEFSPTDVVRILNVLADNVEIGAAGGKFNKRTVVSYGLFAFSLPQGNVFQARIDLDCLQGQFELTASPECVAEAVQDFANPDVDAPGRAASVATGRKPKRPLGLPPRRVPVSVLNGNGVEGSAANAAYHLGRLGYPIALPPSGAPRNAPTWDYERTLVSFDARRNGSEPAARKVARLFEGADVAPLSRTLRRLSDGAMLVVVVGQNFHGSLASAPVDRTPTRKPPAVRSDPDVSLPYVREAARKVRFPVLVPSVLEQSSYPDREQPLRVYKMAGYEAVRLTYLSGAESSAYWGIEMTSWGQAPILEDPNSKLTIGGRRYELHLSGSRIHMVVLRERGATYWVVNTLLNALSNETMLAVAKGLRPLK